MKKSASHLVFISLFAGVLALALFELPGRDTTQLAPLRSFQLLAQSQTFSEGVYVEIQELPDTLVHWISESNLTKYGYSDRSFTNTQLADRIFTIRTKIRNKLFDLGRNILSGHDKYVFTWKNLYGAAATQLEKYAGDSGIPILFRTASGQPETGRVLVIVTAGERRLNASEIPEDMSYDVIRHIHLSKPGGPIAFEEYVLHEYKSRKIYPIDQMLFNPKDTWIALQDDVAHFRNLEGAIPAEELHVKFGPLWGNPNAYKSYLLNLLDNFEAKANLEIGQLAQFYQETGALEGNSIVKFFKNVCSMF